jgi:hypothetical protein
MFFVTQVSGQPGFYSSFGKRLGKLLYDAFRAVKTAGTVAALQNCVRNFFRKGRTFSLP